MTTEFQVGDEIICMGGETTYQVLNIYPGNGEMMYHLYMNDRCLHSANLYHQKWVEKNFVLVSRIGEEKEDD